MVLLVLVLVALVALVVLVVVVRAPEAHVFSLGDEVLAETALLNEVPAANRTNMMLARCMQRNEQLLEGETLQDAWSKTMPSLMPRTDELLPVPAPPEPAIGRARGRAATPGRERGRGRGRGRRRGRWQEAEEDNAEDVVPIAKDNAGGRV